MQRSPDVIEQTAKIGIGTWDFDSKGSALEDVNELNFAWYYNWRAEPLWSPDPSSARGDAEFVPMIWGARDVNDETLAQITRSSADFLLGFNEPNAKSQANMTVQQAIDLWPQLMATGKTLGSPATTTTQTLGEDSWLGRFMAEASARDYRVDFVAVHYYSDNPDIGAFKNFLEAVHAQYQKPIWVTEWALVDWANPDRFSEEQIATFAHDATQMLDDLAFVERHAWFAAYDGGDGWHINTQLIDDQQQLTAVGNTFLHLTQPGEDDLVTGATDSGSSTAGMEADDDLLQVSQDLAGGDQVTLPVRSGTEIPTVADPGTRGDMDGLRQGGDHVPLLGQQAGHSAAANHHSAAAKHHAKGHVTHTGASECGDTATGLGPYLAKLNKHWAGAGGREGWSDGSPFDHVPLLGQQAGHSAAANHHSAAAKLHAKGHVTHTGASECGDTATGLGPYLAKLNKHWAGAGGREGWSDGSPLEHITLLGQQADHSSDCLRDWF